MPEGLLGRKIGMTQVFGEDGVSVPVTVIEAGPCRVTQTKKIDSDGYEAVQVGFGEDSKSRMNKPMSGHFAKSGSVPYRKLGEFRVEDASKYEQGQELTVGMFSAGEMIEVAGTSKGKGFSGVIKRHGFHSGPSGHGSNYHRRPGSLGATDAARVFKGRKLSGRMGHDTVTVKGLKVIEVDPGRNLIVVKGAVPGPRGSYVRVCKVRDASRGRSPEGE